LKAVIIGGGLSGLCLAHALVENGTSVGVFERDPGPEVRGQGYRLTIDETGSRALRTCLPSRNYDFIRATAGVAGKTGAFIFLDERARELHRFTFDLQEGERRGNITGQVDRRTLRQALLCGLHDHVRFGKSFTRYEEAPGGVIAHFDDGSTGRLLTDAGMLALGPRGHIFICTAMQFRESPASAAARLGIKADRWPSEDYFMWAVAVRKHVLDRAAMSELDGTALHEIARGAVGGFHDDYRMLVQHADPNDVVLVPIRVTPPLRSSRPRRVTLVGDAIHTMPPFGAHGANTALKDAQMLASRLLADRARASVEEAIGAFESEMRAYEEHDLPDRLAAS
jgi:2-polyprenyl-6-methoxyphenol hydroxylase-like FAD-dependent oxidoreductase